MLRLALLGIVLLASAGTASTVSKGTEPLDCGRGGGYSVGMDVDDPEIVGFRILHRTEGCQVIVESVTIWYSDGRVVVEHDRDDVVGGPRVPRER